MRTLRIAAIVLVAMYSGAAAAQETEIPLLGVKVTGTSRKDEVGRIVNKMEVTAIRENGPAFFGGIQPGDLLLGFGSMRNLTPERLAFAIPRAYKAGDAALASVGYMMNGAMQPGSTSVRFEEPGAGRWITTRASATNTQPIYLREPLPEVAKARAEAKTRFAELTAAARKSVMAGPCPVPYQRVTTIMKEIDLWAARAGTTASGLDIDLSNLARTTCSNARDGGLPDFEATVVAMMQNPPSIDPCKYIPGKDYSSELANVRSATATGEYQWQVLRYGMLASRARGGPSQYQCLVSFIERTLLGGQ